MRHGDAIGGAAQDEAGDLRAQMVLSYYRLRQLLGLMGFLLPFALIAGSILDQHGIAPSISDYYHRLERDVFVGCLCAISMFLIAYPGHAKGRGERFGDDLVTSLAGFAGLGVAFFPNGGAGPDAPLAALSQLLFGTARVALAHYACAVVFLTCLGYMSFVKFARTADMRRRRIYRLAGLGVWFFTVATVGFSLVKISGTSASYDVVVSARLVFWSETFGLWCFALAWLLKGHADKRKVIPPQRRILGARPLGRL
ncbi:hypothetical protein AQS8620_03050 [Aquimixticola soesokkakensis]|uniref:DUF998 domain-containing protein n=1 Tax=Aquimixticola soesokkakensis TaxID=1519096 RepID=A0A1Y5TKL5_9RHOB|nr:hypothetical protein [Aquimixticola soesokkakensis]SLN65786.1 hypothetical protein AQS8620_03050 [Aquimixticola soesokkakensis]